jgi:hypothetical protein
MIRPSTGGRPLPDPIRTKMESFFGADFSDVRVHVGPEAPSIGALAFTMGSSLYFAPGQYNPDSPQGQALLGHELAHVVQQRQGRVRNPFGSGVAVVQDPHLEAEADRLGQRAAGHRPPDAVQAKMLPTAGQKSPRRPPQSTGNGFTVQMFRHPTTGKLLKKVNVGGSEQYTDGTNFYKLLANGNLRQIKKTKVGVFNRINFARQEGRGAPRAGSFKMREGSGATYDEAKITKRIFKNRVYNISSPISSLTYSSGKRRDYVANMLTATTAEGSCPTASATTYAQHFLGPTPSNYNWCHLIGHGGGGSDTADNLVAASTHCNSEQLLIERIVYQYKQSKLAVRVSAKRHTGSLYLADELRYEVFFDGKMIYSRNMDAHRNSKPSGFELDVIEAMLTTAISGAST